MLPALAFRHYVDHGCSEGYETDFANANYERHESYESHESIEDDDSKHSRCDDSFTCDDKLPGYAKVS